jgi:CRP-like cAMP-binding protein
MRTVELNPGDVLYSEGDASDNIYFVETGKVEVRRGVGKDEVTLATLGKG